MFFSLDIDGFFLLKFVSVLLCELRKAEVKKNIVCLSLCGVWVGGNVANLKALDVRFDKLAFQMFGSYFKIKQSQQIKRDTTPLLNVTL